MKLNDYNFGTLKHNYHTMVQHEQNLVKFKEPLFKKFGRQMKDIIKNNLTQIDKFDKLNQMEK